jgi:hypothetical protein
MLNDIWKFELKRENGHNPKDGACLMDAVSWFEYGTLGDHPACVSPVLAAFCRGANDGMTDAGRQKLKAFIPRLIGSVDPENEKPRAEFLVWQAIRVFTPFCLEKAGLHADAKLLREFSGGFKEAKMELDRIKQTAVADATRASFVASYVAADADARASSRASFDAFVAAADAARAASFVAGVAAVADAEGAASFVAADAASRFGREPLLLTALDGALALGAQGEEMASERIKLANDAFQRARETAADAL